MALGSVVDATRGGDSAVTRVRPARSWTKPPRTYRDPVRPRRAGSRAFRRRYRPQWRASRAAAGLVVVRFGRPTPTEARRLEPVLAQQVVQRRTAHLDVARRTRDVARVAGQRLDEQTPLRLVARGLQRRQRLRRPADRLEFEVLGTQIGILRHDDGALHAVLEFAHVAGPCMRHDGAQCGLREALDAALVLAPVELEEVLGEQAQVVAAFAQRWHLDHDHAEPVVEVLAEATVGDHRLEVAIGGGDDAGIDGARLEPADALHDMVLQEAQELDLQRRGGRGDLVEEDRAVVALLEFADALVHRAGERSAFVPEQFAFKERGGECGAVDADQAGGGAFAVAMNDSRQQFLSCAAFAADQNGGVTAGDLADLGEYGEESGAAAANAFAIEFDIGLLYGVLSGFLLQDCQFRAEGGELPLLL